MTVKDGYDSKPTHISIDTDLDYYDYSVPRIRMAGLNIDQTGVKRTLVGIKLVPAKRNKKYKDFEVVVDEHGKRFTRERIITEVEGLETRALLTLDELLDLRDICNNAIRELTA